jgi:hypothetical protein
MTHIFFETVGSADVHTVVHFPGGFRTLRRSDESNYQLGKPMANPPFTMTMNIDGTIEMRDGDAPWRLFRSAILSCGRTYPEILHYFLTDEVGDDAERA